MFTSHMSYADIIQCLSIVEQEKRPLTPFEFKKISDSVREPFLRAMLQMYPIPSNLRKILHTALEHTKDQVIQNRNQRDHRNESLKTQHQNERFDESHLRVHSDFYFDARSRTNQYFSKTYPSKKNKTLEDNRLILKKLSDFIEKHINTRDVEEQLVIFEKERFKKRLEKFKTRNQQAPAEQNLKSIKQGLRDYLKFLGEKERLQMTFAWDLLDSILIRLTSLQEGSPDYAESALHLIRSIDDARTAYHEDLPNEKIYKPHDYTCPKGLQERLEDQHAHIIDMDFSEDEHKAVENLYGPFVENSSKEEGAQCTFSKRLYDLYIEAADYRKEISIKPGITYLKKGLNVNFEKIKAAYLEGTPEDLHAAHKPVLIVIISTIKNSQGTIDLSLLNKTKPDIANKIIEFLMQYRTETGSALITKAEIKYETLVQGRKEEEIVQYLLEHGPFIDLSHLRNTLAIFDSTVSFESLHSAFIHETKFEDKNPNPLPRQEDMRNEYDRYLRIHPGSFLFFRDFERLEAIITAGIPDRNGMPCHQDTLCDFLSKSHIPNISKHNLNRLALFCVKAGYSFALQLLIAMYGLDLNEMIYGKSLLEEAIDKHDTECFVTLIESGACFQDAELESTLHLDRYDRSLVNQMIERGLIGIEDLFQKAIQKGNHSLVDLLIEMGANPDQEDSFKWNAYTQAALKSFKMLCTIVSATKKYSTLSLWLQSMLNLKESYAIRITALEHLVKQRFFVVCGFLMNIPFQTAFNSVKLTSLGVSFVYATYQKICNLFSSAGYYGLGLLAKIREFKEDVLRIEKVCRDEMEKNYHVIVRNGLFYLKNILTVWMSFYPEKYRSFFDFFMNSFFRNFSVRHVFDFIALIARVLGYAYAIPLFIVVKLANAAIFFLSGMLFIYTAVLIEVLTMPLKIFLEMHALLKGFLSGYYYPPRKMNFSQLFIKIALESFDMSRELYRLDVFHMCQEILGIDSWNGLLITKAFSYFLKNSVYILSQLIRIPLLILRGVFLGACSMINTVLGLLCDTLGIIEKGYHQYHHQSKKFSSIFYKSAHYNYYDITYCPERLLSLYHGLQAYAWDDSISERMIDGFFKNLFYPVSLLFDITYISFLNLLITSLLIEKTLYSLCCDLTSRLFYGKSCFQEKDDSGSFLYEQYCKSDFLLNSAYEKRTAPLGLFSYQEAFLDALNKHYQIDSWRTIGYLMASYIQQQSIVFCDQIIQVSDKLLDKKNYQSFLSYVVPFKGPSPIDLTISQSQPDSPSSERTTVSSVVIAPAVSASMLSMI